MLSIAANHLSKNTSTCKKIWLVELVEPRYILHLRKFFKMKKLPFFCLLLLSLIGTCVHAQDAKKTSEAQRLFAIKSYDKALPAFLEAIQSGEKSPLVNYQTGVCYQKMQNVDDQIKGIPYFEKALAEGKGLAATLPYDLGQLYLKNEQLDKALDAFTRYRDVAKADPKAKANADKAIEICHNAISLMANTS